MSVSAAATLSQIIPVLLLAFVIDVGLTVNPELRGRRRFGAASMLTLLILWLAITEVALVHSVINETPLHPAWAWVAYNGVILGLALTLLSHVVEAWGLAPHQRQARADSGGGADEGASNG